MSSDYRNFLRQELIDWVGGEDKLNLSKLSVQCGFKSRSQLSDILSGRRRFSAAGLQKFLASSPLAEAKNNILQLMVYANEPDLDPHKRPIEQLKKELQTLIHAVQRSESKEDSGNEIFYLDFWPIVYAALGDENGATLQSIKSRTGISNLELRYVLKGMEAKQFVKYDAHSKRYVALSNRLISLFLGRNEKFKSFTSFLLSYCLENLPRNFENPDCFYFSAVYPVDKKKFPDLKKQLGSLLTQFIDKNENQQGDSVSLLSLTHMPYRGNK